MHSGNAHRKGYQRMKNELNKHSNIVLPDLGSCYKKLKQTFTNLSDEELKGLLRPDSVKYYKKGELIYRGRHKNQRLLFSYTAESSKYIKQGMKGKRANYQIRSGRRPLRLPFSHPARTCLHLYRNTFRGNSMLYTRFGFVKLNPE